MGRDSRTRSALLRCTPLHSIHTSIKALTPPPKTIAEGLPKGATGMTEMRGSRKHQEALSNGVFAGYTALFLLLSWGVSGSLAMSARGLPLQLQDSAPASEEWNIAELAELLANAEPQERERKLNNLIEWMQQMSRQQVQQQEEAGFEAGSTRMAVPPPLVHGVASGVRAVEEEDDKGKRGRSEGSFMSLCHFKICNMGRKRNLRYNPWTRA